MLIRIEAKITHKTQVHGQSQIYDKGSVLIEVFGLLPYQNFGR